MAGKDDDIFADDFVENKAQKDVTKEKDFVLPPKEPPKEPKDDDIDDWRIPDKTIPTSKKARKKYAIVGVIIVGVIITLSYFVVAGIEFPDEILQNINPIELGESIDKPEVQETEKPQEQPKADEPFRDVSSTSDKVEVEKTNDVIGYFMVTSENSWYGDYVDFRKIPSKIEKSGNMKVNFRCFTDEFQGTSIYFGTFRNIVDNDLTVEVFIKGIKVDSKSTTSNKALILEGSCYGN